MNIKNAKALLNEIVLGKGLVKDTSTCLMNEQSKTILKFLSYGELQDKAKEALNELAAIEKSKINPDKYYNMHRYDFDLDYGMIKNDETGDYITYDDFVQYIELYHNEQCIKCKAPCEWKITDKDIDNYVVYKTSCGYEQIRQRGDICPKCGHAIKVI